MKGAFLINERIRRQFAELMQIRICKTNICDISVIPPPPPPPPPLLFLSLPSFFLFNLWCHSPEQSPANQAVFAAIIQSLASLGSQRNINDVVSERESRPFPGNTKQLVS